MALCLYLLIIRAVLARIGFDEETETNKRGFLITLSAFVAAVLLVVVGFKLLFRYCFQKGFFIPSFIHFDSCLVLLFLALLLVLTVMFVLRRFFRRFAFRTATIHRWGEMLVMLLQFVLCGLLLTVVYNQEYTRYQNKEIEHLAQTLSEEKDLEFERAYHRFEEAAKADTTFQAMLASHDIMEEVLEDYIRSFLLDTVMEQYLLSVTQCRPAQELELQPYGVVADCGLYFKDKTDIRNHIIARKSEQLFNEAYTDLQEAGITDYVEGILFITDHVLDALNGNKPLLAFIHKDLSWGVFRHALETMITPENIPFTDHIIQLSRDCGAELTDPEVMLFVLVELIGSTAYSAIIYQEPVPLEELKVHLHRLIPGIVDHYIKKAES